MQAEKVPVKNYLLRLTPDTWKWLRAKSFYEERTIANILHTMIAEYRQREDSRITTQTGEDAPSEARHA